MSKRISLTLTICVIAAIAATAGLFLPARQISTAAASQRAVTQQGATQQYSSSSAAQTAQTVSIENFSFSGAAVVGPGEVLMVSNIDGVAHTVTADDGSFDTGIVNGGSTVPLAMPSEPGTYQFFCSIHPSMVSTITVQP